jgi:hypothetical protein
MIKLGECELDYPSITRFKVWVGKREKHVIPPRGILSIN